MYVKRPSLLVSIADLCEDEIKASSLQVPPSGKAQCDIPNWKNCIENGLRFCGEGGVSSPP